MEEGLTDDLSYELGTTSGEEMQNFIENSSVVMDNATMDSGTLCNFGGFQVYLSQLFAKKNNDKIRDSCNTSLHQEVKWQLSNLLTLMVGGFVFTLSP